MKITKIRLKNFKSFDDVVISLSNFNVLIGANASGKSNLIHFFRFLRDLSTVGLNNAVSLQGGIEYIRNIKIGTATTTEIYVEMANKFSVILPYEGRLINMNFGNSTYHLEIKHYRRKAGFQIKKESLNYKVNLVNRRDKTSIWSGNFNILRINQKIKFRPDSREKKILEIFERFSPFPFGNTNLPATVSIFETPFIPISSAKNDFRKIGIYNFEPQLTQKASPITGKAELEENASNLSIVLKNIIENPSKRRKLLNFVRDVLPFIEDINVEKLADKSMLFKIKEKFFNKEYIPASLISEGTINVTALIIALYFEGKNLVAIEEPERNIHPHLLSRIVDLMKDASNRKQIIVTTHNPEFLKFVKLENIILVSRDKNGFTKLSNPLDMNEIKTFLENDIGIDELFVQNLLNIPG